MKNNQFAIQKVVLDALEEDQSSKDITSRTLFDARLQAKAVIVAKEAGVLCGSECAEMVFQTLDPKCRVTPHLKDGEKVTSGKRILSVHGNAVKILAGERTALNFLQQLSGVATLTSRFVQAVRGTKAIIYDTRKTIPGLRCLQKYAVRCGGGTNHRMDLSRTAMVKDNHIQVLKMSGSTLLTLKSRLPKGVLLILEADNLRQVRESLQSGADIILLDNMTIPRLKQAIRMIRTSEVAAIPKIEVSGGVTLENVRAIAKLGVDRISVGALTHSAPALNFSLEIC